MAHDGLGEPAQPGDVAATGLHVAHQAIEQGGLAATIGGDDADAVARIHGKAEIGKKRFAKDDTEVAQRNDGHDVVSGEDGPAPLPARAGRGFGYW